MARGKDLLTARSVSTAELEAQQTIELPERAAVLGALTRYDYANLPG